MFTSITETATEELPPQSSPPWVWIGFLFAGTFFIIEVLWIALELEEAMIDLFLRLILVGSWIYWLVCVHRIHKILSEMSRHRYPISPGEAAVKHIIPFYNLYWIFKWPAELSNYLNNRGRVSIISGAGIGAMLLLALLVRFVDGAIGIAVLFGVTAYVSSKVNKHALAVKGITPDQLPPLPDPKIFSRPLETTTPAAEVVDGPQAG